MKYDFFSRYDFVLFDQFTQQEAVAFLTSHAGKAPKDLPHLDEIPDYFARVALLAQAVNTPSKEYARAGRRTSPGGLVNLYKKECFKSALRDRRKWLSKLGIGHTSIDMKALPKGSWSIHFTFELEKPYLSRDDTDFYIIDNPVKKEWVFKIPYVASSQWKGALRAAMLQELVFGLQDNGNEEEFLDKRVQLWRIFGNEKDGAGAFLNMALARHRCGDKPGDEKKRAERFKDEIAKAAEDFSTILHQKGLLKKTESFVGRLYLYPTFFDSIGIEVLNPHARDKGTGKQPIYFECVPGKTKGEFRALYLPFGDINPKDSMEDLTELVKGIRAMMTVYGFGAKTSSGFGRAAQPLSKGKLEVAGLEDTEEKAPETTAEPQVTSLPRYLSAPGRLLDEFKAADGSMLNKKEYKQSLKSRGKKYTKKNQQLYAKAKGWWEREGKALSEQEDAQTEELHERQKEKEVPVPVILCSFLDWDELQAAAKNLPRLLEKEKNEQ